MKINIKYVKCAYMLERKPVEWVLPAEISDGRLDSLLELFAFLQQATEGEKAGRSVRLNWTKTQKISPAGAAILACLFDVAVEQGKYPESVFIKKRLKEIPVVTNLAAVRDYRELPKPMIHDHTRIDSLLGSGETKLNLDFVERVETRFGPILTEDQMFGVRLILNELIQNTVDHSTSERYYLYAGRGKEDEFHFGVLDMGVSIPAKLETKYACASDVEYLDLALQTGISTRRQRPGGLGLSHTFDFLKEQQGRLTILSRGAQVRRYFKRRHSVADELKYPLRGTWCFARFPIQEGK